MAVPGQPNFENESIIGNIAYENKSLWRFGLGIAEFSHKYSGNDGKISSQILFAEKIWVYQFRSGVSFIGGFGPALFSTKVDGLGNIIKYYSPKPLSWETKVEFPRVGLGIFK